MANLFSLKSIKNKPHRDGFDLSQQNIMTAPLGALIPCMYKDVMPGDSFRINASWFTRSQPCTAPAYSRFTEYVDLFYIPYHFMWRYFPDFISQAGNNNFADDINTTGSPNFTQHPYFTKTGMFGFLTNVNSEAGYSNDVLSQSPRSYNLFGAVGGIDRLLDIKRLFEFLDYGRINLDDTKHTSTQPKYNFSLDTHSDILNPFPLLAYNKIYNDFFRNSQWEKSNPRNFNVDYLTPYGSSMEMPVSSMSIGDTDSKYLDTMFDLKYCNYNKDMFTGVLPNKQFGDTALASPLLDSKGNQMYLANLIGNGFNSTSGEFNSNILISKNLSVPHGDFNNLHVWGNGSTGSAGISALAIRQAEFLQKWKEITQSGGTDYVSQMEKHFGVKPNSDISHRCQYIGGISKNFGADEVVNTNLTGDNEANIMGKCINVGNGNFEFKAREHGIIMAIYHISLLPSYDEASDPLLWKSMPTDYVIPELDNIGMQPVYSRQVAANNGNYIIGYVPRYSEYKSSIDMIHGAFVDSYKNWVTPVTSSFKDSITASNGTTYATFKVSPRTLDNLFNVQYNGKYNTDPFFVNLDFKINAVRNISRDGLPY